MCISDGGQTRPHARLLNLLGVKQLIVGVNKSRLLYTSDAADELTR